MVSEHRILQFATYIIMHDSPASMINNIPVLGNGTGEACVVPDVLGTELEIGVGPIPDKMQE